MRNKAESIVDPRILAWLVFFLGISGFEATDFMFPATAKIKKLISVAVFLIPFIALLQKPVIGKSTVSGLLFLLIPVISSVLNHRAVGSVTRSAYMCYCCFAMILGIDLMVRQIGFQKSVRVLASLLEILLYGNLISMLLYPAGIMTMVGTDLWVGETEHWLLLSRGAARVAGRRVAWLLGHQGLLTFFTITGITCSILRDRPAGEGILTLRTWLLIITSVGQIAYSRSANTLISVTLFFILLFMVSASTIRLPSVLTVSLLLVAAFYGVVYWNIQQYLADFITNVLQRDLSFTGRILVWQNAIRAVAQKPVLGYGVMPTLQSARIMVNATHAHNQWLFIAFQGGLVALVLFQRYIFLVTGTLTKSLTEGNSLPNDRTRSILWVAVVSILVGMLGDRYVPYYNVALIVFQLSVYVDHVESGVHENENE